MFIFKFYTDDAFFPRFKFSCAIALLLIGFFATTKNKYNTFNDNRSLSFISGGCFFGKQDGAVCSEANAKAFVATSSMVFREALAIVPAVIGFVAGPSYLFQYATFMSLNYMATEVLKLSVAKRRPNGANNKSFPSGHTVTAMMVALFVHFKHKWKYALPLYFFVAVMGWARIYTRAHDIFDVMGGLMLPLFIGVITILFVSALQRRRKNG